MKSVFSLYYYLVSDTVLAPEAAMATMLGTRTTGGEPDGMLPVPGTRRWESKRDWKVDLGTARGPVLWASDAGICLHALFHWMGISIPVLVKSRGSQLQGRGR